MIAQLLLIPGEYGRYARPSARTVSARLAWFLQELPSFLVPALMACVTDGDAQGRRLLLCTFTLHYFHRTFVYPLLMQTARPYPVNIAVFGAIFCLINGFIQSHSLLHCSDRDQDRDQVYSLRTAAGVFIFALGMILNIHSDHILRNLRKPGETSYKIPEEDCSSSSPELTSWQRSWNGRVLLWPFGIWPGSPSSSSPPAPSDLEPSDTTDFTWRSFRIILDTGRP
ncbi:hypothetical protein WMY93_005902 [Mugilogobius chulae]|uniref:3-oxo-5-alpha-steroid 4-dehydrogenase C-terminal domain-containing protein n=1 Tax=Mugilogobius chulae TaxID=88201 RepID=A0AAW0PS09_9GOBI